MERRFTERFHGATIHGGMIGDSLEHAEGWLVIHRDLSCRMLPIPLWFSDYQENGTTFSYVMVFPVTLHLWPQWEP